MDEVVNHLRLFCVPKFTVTKEVVLGKTMALAFGAEHLKGGTGDSSVFAGGAPRALW
jgi:hypothetical protein